MTGGQLLENTKIQDGRQRDEISDIFVSISHIELNLVLHMLFS